MEIEGERDVEKKGNKKGGRGERERCRKKRKQERR